MITFATDLKVNCMDIKNIAREKGMTMEQVAAKMGISKGGLSKALNGNPTLKTLRAVAEVLQVPITAFFTDEDEDTRTSISPEEPQSDIMVFCDKCGNVMKFKRVEE